MKNERLIIGICAHVDAGKTTLSEGLLYAAGSIREMGRVDNKNAFLDTDEMERARGITIFSKQAEFVSVRGDVSRAYTLVDTPGHADFSPEMERTLEILDLAVLVISAADGVNTQVRTLWSLLSHYRVPVFIFVNKMDQAEAIGEGDARREAILGEIRDKLTGNAVDFGAGLADQELQENLALCDEKLLDRMMEGENVTEEEVRELVHARKVYPVLFGSALRNQGVRELLSAMDTYAAEPARRKEFGLRVFKITRNETGERLTWVKVTGGVLSARQVLSYEKDGEEFREKVNQIRFYSGEKYTQAKEAAVGEVCALTGLTSTWAGQGMGDEPAGGEGLIAPVLTWKIILPFGHDPFQAYKNLCLLAEEEPMLRAAYDEGRKEITVSLMGEMQREVLKNLAEKRFGMHITFGEPSIIYKETIASAVEGVGHFEPLRHYAEVHLLMEPGERGSGLVFESRCSVDVLAKNWQRLVLTHLKERRHRGVLTGSELTDVKISLIAGRAHEKHTEGGDFRQATYRAVRQGLMQAENILLEPYYDFHMELPAASVGRALLDLNTMGAVFTQPDFSGETAIIDGYAPVSTIGRYSETLSAYTGGQGLVTFTMRGYGPCHNTEEVMDARGYDPEADLRQPSASVFCSHGAGTVVPWYQVRDYMHVDSGWRGGDNWDLAAAEAGPSRAGAGNVRSSFFGEADERTFKEKERSFTAAEDELMAIFERTYGPIKPRAGQRENEPRVYSAEPKPRYRKPQPLPEKEYLLVDGYNIIFAWEELRALAVRDIKAARDRLMDILSNYAGYSKRLVICVFDAYKVSGGQERVYRYHNIDVIFTREAETADQYIEKAAHELTKKYRVTVATSDAVEQVIIYGAGALRLSAPMLKEEIDAAVQEMRDGYVTTPPVGDRRIGTQMADALKDIDLEGKE